MKEHKEYIKYDNLKDATHLEVKVYYTKGGPSYFSGGITPRGYYLSVIPVTVGESFVRFTAFTGQCQLLLETQRYTDKQFARALEISDT